MRSNNEFGAGDVSSSISEFGSMTVQKEKSTFVQGAHGWLARRRRSTTVPMEKGNPNPGKVRHYRQNARTPACDSRRFHLLL